MGPVLIRCQQGFTLLEVMIALTITGMALGGLFSAVGGSKQLSWKSQQAITKSVAARGPTNFFQLHDGQSKLENILENYNFSLQIDENLPEPERKTKPMSYALQPYTLINELTGESIESVRWVKLDLPR